MPACHGRICAQTLGVLGNLRPEVLAFHVEALLLEGRVPRIGAVIPTVFAVTMCIAHIALGMQKRCAAFRLAFAFSDRHFVCTLARGGGEQRRTN